MPTVTVDKARLFNALGQIFTTEEFDELCFEFGIELDEDTSLTDRPIVNGKQEQPQLKIEIPANRYDMLCHEGISLMLNIFRGNSSTPNFRIVAPSDGEIQEIKVNPETAKIRPFISGAILRNIKFTQERYDSFIALQDKLHQNLCRQRTLVSMGTHDLDTIQGPFTYEALKPEEIRFIPLNQENVVNGHELMEFYENDKNLGRYLPIIRNSSVYPVIYDSNRTVCSLPPIINSDHSKLTLDTRNVFIEVTATDKTKLEIVTSILVAMFSVYCDDPFTVECIKIVSPHNHQSRVAPNMSPRYFTAKASYINACCGLRLTPSEICGLLNKMAYIAIPSTSNPDLIEIDVPVTRADVLHQCDIMEDVAIAYGYNKLPKTFPATGTVGRPLPLCKLSDIVREAAAMAGWTEVMPLILCSHDENFDWLNRKDDGKTAIKLANPKTTEYQVVRTSLLPGILKTIRENRKHALPLKVFECSDVALKDETRERKTRNERHFAAAWCGKTSGFEVVHGLLDRLMAILSQEFTEVGELEERVGYWINESSEETYFPGRAANIWTRLKDGKSQVIGSFGILHPTVLGKFDITYPVSTLEINLEMFL